MLASDDPFLMQVVEVLRLRLLFRTTLAKGAACTIDCVARMDSTELAPVQEFACKAQVFTAATRILGVRSRLPIQPEASTKLSSS